MFVLRQVSSNEFSDLEALMKSAVKEKQQFVRLEVKKEDLLEMFKVCCLTWLWNCTVKLVCLFLSFAVQ